MLNIFGNKKVTEKLYEQNLELAVKNKTLSLLEELYQTSIKTLTPEEMAQAVTDIIQKKLNLECVGILLLRKKADTLAPLAFSQSPRLGEALKKYGVHLDAITIAKISNSEFLGRALRSPQGAVTHNLVDVWDHALAPTHLHLMEHELHVKTVLAMPLAIGNAAVAVLLLGFNRDYATLSAFEKKSIYSIADPIGLLLYKAYLYKNLQKAYGVEKKANEELQELDAIKNQFLLTTQHDLRKPLTSVKWFLELLLGGALGKQSKKTLEGARQVQATVENSIEQVNNFLDIAQFQMGKSAIKCEPGVDLLAMMDKIINQLQRQAQEKQIYLNMEKPESLPAIAADAIKLKAAIANIIDNAIKYTPHGGVTVKIKNLELKILIEVHDTGIGIPQDKVKTLFEHMFERTEQAKRTTSMGKGIGLYLSAQIIKGHGGKIWAESQGENKGSAFFIELPIQNSTIK